MAVAIALFLVENFIINCIAFSLKSVYEVRANDTRARLKIGKSESIFGPGCRFISLGFIILLRIFKLQY